MRKVLLFLLVFVALVTPSATAQRRGTGGGRANVTFAVVVTDPAGTPVGNVLVTLDGPARRSARTEAGRIAFEGLPAGAYTLRFEREGFVTLEREVTARGGAPIDVKVTLAPLPAPVAPPEPVSPAPLDVKPVTIDLPAFVKDNYVGRGAGKTLPLACATDGTATLLQLNAPLTEQVHASADEFLYVIAGQGNIKIDARQEPLQAGVLVLVPRGAAHTLTASGRGPLVVLATRAGEGCAAPHPAR